MARPRGALALVLLGLLAGCADTPDDRARDRQGRPNVVVLMTDDQTVESMRVMPGVRRTLAARGTTFSRSFVSFPLCCPSRATLLTGQYAHNHGVLGNSPPWGGHDLFDPKDGNTLATWLSAGGYATVMLGKYLNGYGATQPRHVPPGWTEWKVSVGAPAPTSTATSP